MTKTHMRAVPVTKIEETERDDGSRLLSGRLVPYDMPAMVMDEKPDGRPDIYEEGFKRGAFDGQVTNSATNKGVLQKIGFIHRHEGGLGYLGPFIALRDEPDGLYGDVVVLPSFAANVGALLKAGVDELSIEFRLPGDAAMNTVTDDKGVRWRTKAHLDQVALEPKGAYRSAQVLQYRNEIDDLERQAAEKVAEDEAEAARLASEQQSVEAEAEAIAVRKRQAAEFEQRYDMAHAQQAELERQYGPAPSKHATRVKSDYGHEWREELTR